MKTEMTLDASTTEAQPKKSIARYAPAAARVLMGLLFLFTGLNGLFNFLPPPSEPMPEAVTAFTGALLNSRYMFPLIGGTQALVGALLLLNRFVPLALALIAPVIVNIVLVHVFLAPQGLVMALVVLALELYLAWSYRSAFKPMLKARVTPG